MPEKSFEKDIGCKGAIRNARVLRYYYLLLMAGPGNDPVQGFSTGLPLHWEFLRLWTGFELSSSCIKVPCYALNLNRNILDFMRWSDFGLGAQDLNDTQRPKSFQKNSWK